MLTAEDNELISRIGPGTLMGGLLRQYWLPALLSSEVIADGEPVRTLLLGEKLIAFRDTNGQIGLMQDHCPHRGASLFFGRNEEAGLRCVYHGWKFDVSGQCIDMPNEPAESNFKSKMRALAYPCLERNGLVWAYLGPRPTPPPLPDLEANMLPAGEWTVTAIQRECNWLQALEGDIDTSHAGLLHFGSIGEDDMPAGTFSHYLVRERAPRYSILDTDVGTMYGAYRSAAPGFEYWRLAHFMFPIYAIPPQGLLGSKVVAFARVPLDDEHTLTFTMMPKPDAGAVVSGADRLANGSHMLPNSTDWLGRFRLAANTENDYQLDRALQRDNRGADGFTGIRGVGLQDQAITESMGPIIDRTREHLGSSDSMVIRVRRRLLDAAHALAGHGATPPGVDTPAAYRVRAGGVFLPAGSDWVAATASLRQAFVSHPDLDPTVTGPIAAGEFNGRTE